LKHEPAIHLYFARVAVAVLGISLANAGQAAQQRSAVSDRADGSVAVTVDGEEVIVPVEVDAQIVEALAGNAGDPDALAASIRGIVATHAQGAEAQALAVAIAVLAVVRSDGSAQTIAAILEGVAAGNPTIRIPSVLAVLPTSVGRSVVQRPEVLATLENPHQVSPVGL